MPLKTHQEELPAINLTPMIDVVFLLLIFFMVGTNFSDAERRIELEVPKVSGASALVAPPESRVLNVARDGTITLERQPVTLSQLIGQLQMAREQYPDISVLVRIDGKVSYDRAAEVLDACNQAKVRINMAIRPGNVVR